MVCVLYVSGQVYVGEIICIVKVRKAAVGCDLKSSAGEKGIVEPCAAAAETL